MNEPAISADSHLDLTWMPGNLFVENASAELRDRMPYVVETDEGRRWTTKSGANLGFQGAVGATGGKYIPGRLRRADIMAAEGFYSDGAKGVLRVSTPELRLKDQDRDGVVGEVLYGILGITSRVGDVGASVEMLRIYNDWLSGFCAHAPERLLGLIELPSHEPAAAVAELKRARQLPHMRGVDMSAAPQRIPFYHPAWAEFWHELEATGMPMHFHTFGPDIIDTTGFDDQTKIYARAAAFAGAQFYRASRITMDLIMGSVLEKHPDVKIVLGEAGVGWIPYVLNRMDMMHRDEFHHSIKLSMKPSEFWYRQCHVSFQDEESAIPVFELAGYDNLLWASDFPHPDGLWPESHSFIKSHFGHLPQPVRHKIIYGNAARLYGLKDGHPQAKAA